MPRARWVVIAALSVVTVTVVVLDLTGVIFEPTPEAVPPPPLQFQAAQPISNPMTPVDPTDPASLSPRVEHDVDAALSAAALGDAVHAVVTTAGGGVLLSRQPSSPVAPASSLKLLTALSVLDVLPSDATLTTSVVASDDDTSLVLVGGGDATLAVQAPRANQPQVASLAELARLTSKRLDADGVTHVALAYDDSAFVGPSIAPEWEPTYVTSGVIAPVTALMADQGLVNKDSLARYPDPAQAAADDFATLLKAQGIDVKGDVTPGSASHDTSVAQVESPPVPVLVQHMLRDSDNQLAEALARVAAAESDFPPSFTGGVEAMTAAAERHGITVDADSVFDSSGLSRDDRVTVAALVAVLQTAAVDGQFRPIVDGLPIAGFDGTLFDRYLDRPQSKAAGIVRAKTGTLTGVSTESGSAVTCGGALVLFSFAADEVSFDTEAARDALDRAAAALTQCG